MYREKRRRQCCRAFAALALSTALFMPLPAHAMSLTLTEAIDMALASNTGLRITAEGERSADAVLPRAPPVLRREGPPLPCARSP